MNLKIEYDNNINEIEAAFMQHWRKYSLGRTVMFTVVALIVVGLCVNIVISNMSNPGLSIGIGGVGAGLSAGMAVSLWLKPSRKRKYLVMTLSQMNQESYTASFNSDNIEIETVIEKSEESQESENLISKSKYELATEEFYSKETAELFLLYVNKVLIYVFPKRCMDDSQIENLRTYFTKNNI